MRFRILDRYWELKFVTLANSFHGLCDHPKKKGKSIRIDKHITGWKLLETLLHEVLHAADWDKDEEWIEYTARDIARLLWKLGYRMKEEPTDGRSIGTSDGSKASGGCAFGGASNGQGHSPERVACGGKRRGNSRAGYGRDPRRGIFDPDSAEVPSGHVREMSDDHVREEPRLHERERGPLREL